MNITPAKIRSRMEQVLSELVELERDMEGPLSKGVEQFRGPCFELSEASDDVRRAIELLDENYASAS